MPLPPPAGIGRERTGDNKNMFLLDIFVGA